MPKLPAVFKDGALVEETRMQAQLLWHCRQHLRAVFASEPSLLQHLSHFEASFDPDQPLSATAANELAAGIRELLSAYNLTTHRLGIENKQDWPRQELTDRARETFHPFTMLPVPTPCEHIDESFGWWGWGSHCKKEQWIGHGFWWRSRPSELAEPLDNMAGSSMHDFDGLEDGFARLKTASVLMADYSLLRNDFPELALLADSDVDEWLLSNAAFISEGQVQRLSPGGDHHKLLGIDKIPGGLEGVLDLEQRRSGIRQRSGGRAATFLVNDGEYAFTGDGSGGSRSFLVAGMLDVKGVGTHIASDHSSNVRNTGLLNYADALREFGLQRLVQRVADIEGEPWTTVKFYAILDTGLAYSDGQLNPATGWSGEKCVLCVRQRQSRAFVAYEGYNFSGVLLMTGEECPAPSQFAGTGRRVRRVLTKHGLSSEFQPKALFLPEDADPLSEAALDDISGNWNLQADAALSHLMDFSDYYVLPSSTLPPAWRMSEAALSKALCLERSQVLEDLWQSPSLLRRVFGTEDVETATKEYKRRLLALSRDPKMLEAASGTRPLEASEEQEAEPGQVVIKPGKPKYCQCWFMELDDSEFSKWALNEGNGAVGPALLQRIEAWLPAAPST
eukprot:TRINITY_DN20556_c0_g3_i1.p1 TRINITY_DN20556_c0_g3~~TRINITY_DN20556_c0_g3_i1.p1  ORF type:complete len:619 (+),score=134.64 TRINITY_DN20556_c0_g3_i1:38-1894(+)